MGVYKYIRDLWKVPQGEFKEIQKERLQLWRDEGASVRVLRPLRLDRARSLGYRAKPGYIIVRQRVTRGARKREKIMGGRRSKHNRRRKVLAQSLQVLCEQRASREYDNCEVLNSYWVGQDKNYKWYEVILVDRTHKAVLNDLPHLAKSRGRALRGLTSAGKKSRGLRYTGQGAEKARGKMARRYS